MEKQLRLLSEKINQLKNTITTEEATKTSFILPFLQILGYDVFNPKELIAESISDVGGKKGEKVDYLISKNNIPIIIIECKKWTESLENHKNQLIRYYHTSKSKFGLLTNGIEYQFFTDSENPNIMDETPFFVFNILNFSESDCNLLSNFSKVNFDQDNIIKIVNNLKYLSKFKSVILNELNEPSREFSELIIKKIFTGRLTQKVFETNNPILIQALSELFPKTESEVIIDKKINTTEEELQFFNDLIKAIPEYENNLSYKDFIGHFNVIFDKSPRKCVVKALFNGVKKYIILFNDEGEIKQEYFGINDEILEIIKLRISSFKK